MGKTNLITSFVRRITKSFVASENSWWRPYSALPGTNHIDNPNDFTPTTIYKSEEIIDTDRGRLYTQDGAEIIEPNMTDVIINGLNVISDENNPLWLSVTSGSVRISGKTYWHQQNDPGLGDIQIDPNDDPALGRYDVITVKSAYPNPALNDIDTNSEYRLELSYYTGELYTAGHPTSFAGDVLSGSTSLTYKGDLPVGTTAGVQIVGPVLAPGSTVISAASGAITLSDPAGDTLTNATFAYAYDVNNQQRAFYAFGESGTNELLNCYPISGLTTDMYIIGEGIPEGTYITGVDGDTVYLSANLTRYFDGVCYLADAADILSYDVLGSWRNEKEMVIGIVWVPPGYNETSDNQLRPISVCTAPMAMFGDGRYSIETSPKTAADIIKDQRSKIQDYVSDRSWISDTIVLDRAAHQLFQVIENHYSIDVATSVASGYMVQVSGSSSGGGSSSSITLPVPDVKLISYQDTYIDTWDPTTNTPGDATYLIKPPVVRVSDLTQEQIDNNQIFVEMVMYRRSRKRAHKIDEYPKSAKSGYVVPSAHYYDSPELYPPWNNETKTFWNRSGSQIDSSTGDPIGVNRPNHYPVTAVNETINVYEYLNGRYQLYDVQYRDSSGDDEAILNTLVNITRKKKCGRKPTSRFGYASTYTPVYVAFRYIIWDPLANDGRGNIISGPLSRVVKISHDQFPFNPDYVASGTLGLPCVSVSPDHDPLILQCMFETKLP